MFNELSQAIYLLENYNKSSWKYYSKLNKQNI